MRFFIKALPVIFFVFIIGCTQPDQQASNNEIINPVDISVIPQNENIPLPNTAVQSGIKQDKSKQESVITLQKQRVSEYEMHDALTPSEMYSSKEQSLARSVAPPGLVLGSIRSPSEPLNRENYAHYDDNPVKRAIEHPLSTFSIDVDTGSYANVRRFLKAGTLPDRDAVRAEEMVNYFSYDYPLPENSTTPFSLIREIAPTPWNPGTYLLHIGIQGYDIPKQQIPAANLVFLIDISGSMNSPDKLGLLKSSLKLLTNHLHANDKISIVVYAGGTGVVLEPTSGNQKVSIITAIDQLTAGGRTNGAAGINLAYAMAEQGFIHNGINRVLLATDGDFNVGTTGIEQLKDLIAEKRKSGIALSTLGFGTGNYNDHLMEQLADTGDGNYAYIDTLGEAQKVLVDEMTSTLMTIARDVKIQVEFNPDIVEEYRLIGYENRLLNREDFNNDKIDAGEIGAGHSVTAMYEIALKGSLGVQIDPLRYQSRDKIYTGKNSEIAFLRIRYKQPQADTSQLLEWPIQKLEIVSDLQKTTATFRFSAAIAAFAQLLRGGDDTKNFSYTDIMALANGARGNDPFGYQGEFLTLVNLAKSLSGKIHEPEKLAENNRN
jgi:Ca-activated chloride channel homolog